MKSQKPSLGGTDHPDDDEPPSSTSRLERNSTRPANVAYLSAGSADRQERIGKEPSQTGRPVVTPPDRRESSDDISAPPGSYLRMVYEIYDPVWKWFLTHEVPSADADDLADRVMDLLLKNYKKYDSGQSIKYWAYGFCYNVYRNYLRHCDVKRYHESGVYVYTYSTRGNPTPEDSVLFLEKQSLIISCLEEKLKNGSREEKYFAELIKHRHFLRCDESKLAVLFGKPKTKIVSDLSKAATWINEIAELRRRR